MIPAPIEALATQIRAVLVSGQIANVGYAPGNGGRYNLLFIDLSNATSIDAGHNSPAEASGLLVIGRGPGYRFTLTTPRALTAGDVFPDSLVAKAAHIPDELGGDTLALWVLINLVLDVPAGDLYDLLSAKPSWQAAVEMWGRNQ